MKKTGQLKKRVFWPVIIALIIILLLTPLFSFIKSIFVMSIYSASEKNRSMLKAESIDIYMPGGLSTYKKDWYPFVITYNADGFSRYVHRDIDLTILYNFGAFDYKKGASSLYNPMSDFHGAFYGAYAVKVKDNLYGYDINGKLNVDEMADIFKFDMQVLVLDSIGCDSSEFDFNITNIEKKSDFLGFTWDVIDANIITNSPYHHVTKHYSAYIQYGKPKGDIPNASFSPFETKGRIYATYLDDKNITLCFYIIAPNKEALETCAADFIEKSKINMK